MGLSISRSIVEAHGGHLWAENNPDRGATFHLVLPVFSDAANIPASPRMTVFLVDDDNSVRKALARLIRAAGYEIKTFASAQEFIESMPETAGVACLVLDVRMPGLNGLDLQNAMRAANMPIPIIFITGHGDIPMSVRAMKAGAVDFLPKPVHSKVLLARHRSSAGARGTGEQGFGGNKTAASVLR